MSLTINVNDLTLCHQGSGGIAVATAPDVCKTPTPGGPVPVPYPNIARSADLAKGTRTVFADGGHSIAISTSEFSVSTGDEPGTVGGVKSGTNMSRATWLSYSADVFIEGGNACRLTDKMLMNDGNTVCLAGLLQAPLDAWPELMIICAHVCACDKAPITSASGASELKELCVKAALLAEDTALQDSYPIKPEIPYNMTTPTPTPILHQGPGLRPTTWLPGRMAAMGLKAAGANGGIYQVRIPDVIVVRDLTQPLTAPNLKAVVEIKFNNQARDINQISDYERIAGDPNRVIELDPQQCMCNLPEGRRQRVLEELRNPTTEPGVFDLAYWEKLTGLTGVALILFLVVWEGLARLFPPRNLVPA